VHAADEETAMDMVLRATYFYALVMLVYLTADKRAQGQLNAFDFVMMLVVAAAAGAGMMGNVSLVDATLVLITLTGWNIVTTSAKRRWVRFDRLIDGVPIVLVEHGQVLKDRLKTTRVREEEIMSAARAVQVERFDQIKYAILERRGDISVIKQ
jgi:uncharacterized membrane protein YcaP (DUF421 family)